MQVQTPLFVHLAACGQHRRLGGSPYNSLSLYRSHAPCRQTRSRNAQRPALETRSRGADGRERDGGGEIVIKSGNFQPCQREDSGTEFGHYGYIIIVDARRYVNPFVQGFTNSPSTPRPPRQVAPRGVGRCVLEARPGRRPRRPSCTPARCRHCRPSRRSDRRRRRRRRWDC